MSDARRTLIAASIILMMALIVVPTSPPGFLPTLLPDENVSPDQQRDSPNLMLDGEFNLTNDYQLIWEPNNIQGSSHAVATSPNKNLIAVAGGYLSDSEVHVYRWDNASKDYIHVWDAGNDLIRSDVQDVAIADADNNGLLEVYAASADGRIYVFEARGFEEGFVYLDNANNVFELVWDSQLAIRRQVWSVKVEDVDHDNQGEIVAGCWDNRVHVFDYVDHSNYPYCPSHSMSFIHVWDSGNQIGGRVYDVAVGDTDCDGRTDILAASYDCRVYVFEEIPCFKHTYQKKWDSGDAMSKPVISMAVSNNLDEDQYGEIVASAYGDGVYVFEYNSTSASYDVLRINRQLESWEEGTVYTAGVWTGYEADPYVDKKVYGWEEQGVYELDPRPYPWKTIAIGGNSCLGGPRDLNCTTFQLPEVYSYLSTWGANGSLAGQFYLPDDIAFDSYSNAYVLDTSNSRVQKLTGAGQFVDAWGELGSGVGQFKWPQGICVDAQSYVYVSDTWNHRIVKLNPDGVWLASWGNEGTGLGQFEYPMGIAADSSGRLYVCDSLNMRIQVLDTESGAVVNSWGANGSGPGQFYYPLAIAVSELGIYVADTYNNRVQMFTSEGDFVLQWGKLGEDAGDFGYPDGIACDLEGNVYVSDTGYDHIEKFTASGRLITNFGSTGTGFGELTGPRGLEVAPNGAVYVVDSSNSRVEGFAIQKYSLDKTIGSLGTKVGQFYFPSDAAIDDQGYIFVSDSSNNRIQKLAGDGTCITLWGELGAGEGQFNFTSGIAVGNGNSVYVVDRNNNRIQRFDSEGNFLRAWGVKGSGDGELLSPTDIDIGPDGTLYVTDTGNDRISLFTSEGDFIRTFGSHGDQPNQVDTPYGIAVNEQGTIFVTERGNNRIHLFDSEGTSVAYWTGEFSEPLRIEHDGYGNLYLTVIKGTAIALMKFTMEGMPLGSLPTTISNYRTSVDLQMPLGITFDRAGDLLIVDTWAGVVVRTYTDFVLNSVAEAIVDFGQYEELGGSASSRADLWLYFPDDDPELEDLEFAISQDQQTFVDISATSITKSYIFIMSYGLVRLIGINVDQVLRQNGWENYRYLKIGVKNGASYNIDSAYGTLSRPIDNALVVTTGQIDHTDEGDTTEYIIMGTVDGAISAYTSSGAAIWQSTEESPRFDLNVSIRDIVELDRRGRMPTWHYTGNLVTGSYLGTLGLGTFSRIEGYTMGDIDDDGDLDMMLSMNVGTYSALVYLSNTGTNSNPNYVYHTDYFEDHTSLGGNTIFGFSVPYLADLDSDGDLDLIISEFETDIEGVVHLWYLRYFERTAADYFTEVSSVFTTPNTVIQSEAILAYPSFKDMDGDGDLDLTLGCDSLYYFKRSGTGSSFFWTEDDEFYDAINKTMRPTEVVGRVAFCDFDRDGDWDLTIAHAYENYTHDGLKPATSRLTYWENTGYLTRPEWVKRRPFYDPDFRGSALTEDRGYCEPYVYDMSGDGVLDLMAMQNSSIDCYYGSLKHNSYVLATYPLVHMIEIDQRSESDYYYGYSAYDSWDNHPALDNWTCSIAYDDTDDDGKGDVVVGSFDNNIYTFEWCANNTYRRAWRSSDLTHGVLEYLSYHTAWDDVRDITIEDTDNDNKKEIVAVSGYSVFVFENVVNDVYQLVWGSGDTIPAMMGVDYPVVSTVTVDKDLDGDDRPDIIVTSQAWVFVYEWIGDDQYSLVYSDMVALTGKIYDILTADTDGDGFREIILGGASEWYDVCGLAKDREGWVIVYENMKDDDRHVDNGYEYETFVGSYGLYGVYSLAVADNDQDGWPELFVGYEQTSTLDSGIDIWEANGENSYIMWRRYSTPKAVTSMLIANTDGDSWMEIIAGSGKRVMVLEQNWTYTGGDMSLKYYTYVWNSSSLAENITDLAIGDSNGNGRLEIFVSAAKGNVYGFEWVQNATSTQNPAVALAASESEWSDAASRCSGNPICCTDASPTKAGNSLSSGNVDISTRSAKTHTGCVLDRRLEK